LVSARAAAIDTHTLSLHDALPISGQVAEPGRGHSFGIVHRLYDLRELDDLFTVVEKVAHDLVEIATAQHLQQNLPYLVFRYVELDRKSTRLNSSHVKISYAVFCLK